LSAVRLFIIVASGRIYILFRFISLKVFYGYLYFRRENVRVLEIRTYFVSLGLYDYYSIKFTRCFSILCYTKTRFTFMIRTRELSSRSGKITISFWYWRNVSRIRNIYTRIYSSSWRSKRKKTLRVIRDRGNVEERQKTINGRFSSSKKPSSNQRQPTGYNHRYVCKDFPSVRHKTPITTYVGLFFFAKSRWENDSARFLTLRTVLPLDWKTRNESSLSNWRRAGNSGRSDESSPPRTKTRNVNEDDSHGPGPVYSLPDPAEQNPRLVRLEKAKKAG